MVKDIPWGQLFDFWQEYNCDFMECSAATGENVVQSLEIVAR